MSFRSRFALVACALGFLGACSDDSSGPDGGGGPPVQMTVLGHGPVLERITGEVASRGNVAYTTTWFCRGSICGNAVKVWNVSGAAPVLADSLIVQGATTLGDVQISDDGRLLVVAVEPAPNGAIMMYDLTDPLHPAFISRFSNQDTSPGVHTVKLARVNGRHYAFLSIDPNPARLVIVDITTPSSPNQVLSRVMGNPYVHDVFVRDGLLFTALWDDGLTIWDIGGGGLPNASPSNPVQLGNVKTVNGNVHNVHWFHDPTNSSKRYAFIGEEGPGTGSRGSPGSSSGDIHVVDVSNLRVPVEIGFFHVDSAGVHNFSVDEQSGILYAAYYNAGVRALDIRGDLSGCTSAQKAPDGRCDLGLMKRERGRALTDRPVAVWGVAVNGNRLYASDMINGLFKIDISALKR